MGGSWTMTDAWVFAALANDRPARVHTLAEVIAVADGINHAVLTEEEFTAAAGRLAAAGLIDADAARERYWPTEAGANLRRRWRHGAFGWIEAIPPGLRRLGEPQDSDWPLPAGVFDAAVREYLARAAEWKKPRKSSSGTGHRMRSREG